MAFDRSVEVVPWGPDLHESLSNILEQHERNPDRIGAPLIVMPSDEGRRTLLKSVQKRMQGPIDTGRVTTVRGLAQRCLLDFEIQDPLPSIIAEELVVGQSIIGLDDSIRWRIKDEYVLYQSLLKESIPKARLTDTIDFNIISRSLRTIRQRIGRTTFEVQMEDLLEKLEGGTTPFTLLHASEVLLIHIPSATSGQMLKFLRVIEQHVPIHEIHAPGSLSDGRAGVRLWSESVPAEKITPDSTHVSELPTYVRIGTEGSEGEIEASLSIIQGYISSSTDSLPSVTIVDWAYDHRGDLWDRHLLASGYWEYQPEHKVGPSLRHLIETATSADAWSRTRMRRLSRDVPLNSVLSTFIQGGEDPDHPLNVMLDLHEVSELGGVHHIVGGSGALIAWLDVLDAPLRADLHPRRLEARQCTQLALHALARLLGPWLTPSDRQRLSQEVVGCHDQEIHLFPPPLSDPVESISLLVQACPGQGTSTDFVDSMSSIQDLMNFESILGIDSDQSPSVWAERFFRILEEQPLPSRHRHCIQVLSPEQAAGSNCNLLILAGLSSEYSSTIIRSPPLLDDKKALDIGFRGPRDALGSHLQMMDLCFASGMEVIMLDPSADGTTPLSLPTLNIIEHLTWEKPCEWLQNSPGMFVEDGEWNHSRWKTHGHHLLPTSDLHPHRRARLGVMARDGKVSDPLHRPLNKRSVSFPFDGQMLRNNLANQPRNAEVDEIFLFPERHPSLWSISKMPLIPSSKNVGLHMPEYRPANQPPGILLGGLSPNGNNNPSRDPRPFHPLPSGIASHDARMGEGPTIKLDRWSASGLRSWLECPRRAWMTRVLQAQSTDAQDDDVASYRVGNILHRAWAETIADKLGFMIHKERPDGGQNRLESSHCGIDDVIEDLTLRLLRQEAWLRSGDAGAAALHRHLFGQDPWPIPNTDDHESVLPKIGGVVRHLVESEFDLDLHRILSLEHQFDTSHPESPLVGPERSVHGAIDRVDQLPLSSGEWFTSDAPLSVIPLGPERAESNPRRCIMIRDIKFIQRSDERKDPKKRWSKMIFEEVQLALYARAWEVTNPGDMVVGVGGVIIGAQVDHFNIKRQSHKGPDEPDYGLSMMHGITSSGHSDPFDGWLQERLSVAKNVIDAANKGRVPPTEGPHCSHCPVISACPVGHREDLPRT